MPADIPTEIKFKHLLAHTFPGFFLALTVFMLISVWSPIDITAIAIKDITGLATFIGFILLIGTILRHYFRWNSPLNNRGCNLRSF